jgi:hypothetical protein
VLTDVSVTRRELAESAASLEADIARRLNGPRSARGLRKRVARHDPELVRVWGRIRESLADLELLLGRTEPTVGGAERELDTILRSAPNQADEWTLEFARGLDHALRAVVPLFADVAYLRASLGAAKTSERLAKSVGGDRAKELRRLLMSDEPSPDDVAEIAFGLRRVAQDRANKRRKDHARLAVREALLRQMLLPLLALVVAVSVVLAVAGESTGWFVVVGAATGALGSMLSGSFRLRDELRRLTDLRAFRPALWVQPLLGAAAGLFAFLVVRADVLRVPSQSPGSSLTAYGVYGFLAGFSEPFLLGIVKRLAAEPDQAKTTREDGGQTHV